MKSTAKFDFLKETLQKPGIFYKILGALVLLALIITLLIAVFLSNLLSENKSQQIDEISILRLEQAAETLETAFDSLESSINNLHWNSDFIRFSVNPGETDISRDQSILQTMGYIYLDDLVDELYFISCYSDQVFTGRGDILSLEEEELTDLWAAYQALDLSETAVSEISTRNALFLDETGELYLCSELIVGNPISVLICRIDREAMSRMLRMDSEEPDSYLCIFDGNGNALLEDCYAYWCTGTDLEDASLFMMSGEAPKRSNIYYLYVSDSNGWYYVSQRDNGFFQVSFGELVSLLLPVLGIIILVSLLFSWYIAQSVYRPIGSLVQLFMGGESEDENAVTEPRKDAFAYMEDAYRRMAGENRKARSMAKEFSVKILKDTMKRILDGRLLSDEYLEETLHNIGDPVAIQDRYMLLLGHLEPPEASPSQNMEQNMYIISIYEKISAWEPENPDILVLAIYTYFDTFAVVLSAPSRVSAIALQREALRIREEITRIGENFPYRFYLGMGRVYEHISDLKYSYDDARRSLQRQMYHEGTSETENRLETGDETTRYMERRLEQITAEIDEANREESEVLIRRSLEEIAQKTESTEQARGLFEQLCNHLLEKMLSLHIPEGEVKTIYPQPIRKLLSEGKTMEELAQTTDKICQQSLWLIEMYSRKSKYVYVEEAESYIRQHYKDCDLSQNEIAEHIGISPSYLSERFREVTGESLIAYLNRYRVEQAKLLLTTSSVSVGEIGFLCGFHSAQNFSRVFRKYIGMTPSQYRTRNQQS